MADLELFDLHNFNKMIKKNSKTNCNSSRMKTPEGNIGKCQGTVSSVLASPYDGEANTTAPRAMQDPNEKLQQALSSPFETKPPFETSIGRSDTIIRTFLKELDQVLLMLSDSSTRVKKDPQVRPITKGELLTFYNRHRMLQFLTRPSFRSVQPPLDDKVVDHMRNWLSENRTRKFKDCFDSTSLHDTGWKFLDNFGVELRGELSRASVRALVEKPSPKKMLNISSHLSPFDMGASLASVSAPVAKPWPTKGSPPHSPVKIASNATNSSAANIHKGKIPVNSANDSRMEMKADHGPRFGGGGRVSMTSSNKFTGTRARAKAILHSSHSADGSIPHRDERQNTATLASTNQETPQDRSHSGSALRPLATRTSRRSTGPPANISKFSKTGKLN